MGFEKYIKPKRKLASPRANLNKSQMILSTAAAGMIDTDVQFAQLHFDRESRTIAIEPLAGQIEGCSRLIRSKGGRVTGFTMVGFFDHFGVTERGLYPVRWEPEPGWFAVDLTKPLKRRFGKKAGE